MWEHGSEFHVCIDSGPGEPLPYIAQSTHFGSGRHALLALIKLQKWPKIWCPSYYCQPVIEAIESFGIQVERYMDSPVLPLSKLQVGEGEPVLVVNYFGLRTQVESFRGFLIEDHTHDLLSDWACHSRADYCFASLRKTLPIPDGGILWSPQGFEIPAEPLLTQTHTLAYQQKLEAMILKSRYLAGDNISKQSYRNLATLGESTLGLGPVSGMSEYSKNVIKDFPIKQWREQRLQNFKVARELLDGHPRVKLLLGEVGCVPFSLNLLFQEASVRDKVKFGLIQSKIYPAVLWPDNQSDLSNRLLSVSCDHRYGVSDIKTVAEKIIELAWK
jgi:hypothetical protein